MSNPFEVFDLAPTYAIDLNALDRLYFNMQKEFHPDKNFESSTYSSLVNAAYQILKHPVKRAESLLEILGIPVPGSEGQTIENNEWLLDIFDFQEAIMVCESEEEATHLKDELEELFGEEQHRFSHAFDNGIHDELPEIYVKLSYLDKLQKQLSEVEEQFYNVKRAVH